LIWRRVASGNDDIVGANRKSFGFDGGEANGEDGFDIEEADNREEIDLEGGRKRREEAHGDVLIIIDTLRVCLDRII